MVEAGSVPVFDQQENGLLGFALDPQFAQNHWIYLLYSPTNFVGQRLSRFQMDGDRLDLASEKEVFRFDEQRRECCHHAGSVRFAPDGCLLISTGDNTNPFGDSESYGPMDERPNMEPWDAQRTAGNTASKNGKILRVRLTRRRRLHHSRRQFISQRWLGWVPGNLCDGLPQSLADECG